MADEWPTVRIGDLADSISDTHKFGKDSLIFLNTSDVLLGKILHHSYSAVSEWPGQAKKSIQKGDILFSEIRPANGRWAYVDIDAFDYVVSTKLMVIRSRPVVLPRFLYHFLTRPETTDWLQHLAESRSGTFPQITFDQVAELEIALPPLVTQARIVSFLDAIEDKIELNRRMKETLEAIARVLFKSWFVEKVQGGFPKGWCAGKIDELVNLCRDTVSPSEFPNETFDHYSIPAFDEGRLAKAETGEQILSNKFLVPPNAIMISKLNPRIPRVWLPRISNSTRSISSTEFLVAVPKHDISREWLYGLFSSDAFLDEFATFVTGTSGSHQRVKPEYLLTMGADIPPKEHITGYTALTKPLHDRIALNREESRTLAALRDALLPKLISGDLRVKNAEKMVGSVA